MCLLTGSSLQRDIAAAIRYFTLSAENGSSDGQAVVEWMTENGIGTAADVAAAAPYDKLLANHSRAGAFHFGRCCQSGRGIPVDVAVSAQFFRKATESGNADGGNSFGCCLELGEGINSNIELAVKYCSQPAYRTVGDGSVNHRLGWPLGRIRELRISPLDLLLNHRLHILASGCAFIAVKE
jgi:TPR repeat protein